MEKLTQPYDQLSELLHTLSRTLRERSRRVARWYDIPEAAIAVLGCINREPGISLSEIARRSGIVKSQVCTVLDDLVERGWAHRESDPADRRLVRLYMTSAAQATWEQAKTTVRQDLSQLLEALSPERAALLVDLARELQGVLTRAPVPGAPVVSAMQEKESPT